MNGLCETLLNIIGFYAYQWRLTPATLEELFAIEIADANRTEKLFIRSMEQLCAAVATVYGINQSPDSALGCGIELQIALVDANSITRPRNVQLLRLTSSGSGKRRPVDSLCRRILRSIVQLESERMVDCSRLHLLIRQSAELNQTLAETGFFPCRMFCASCAHKESTLKICLDTGDVSVGDVEYDTDSSLLIWYSLNRPLERVVIQNK